MIKLKFRRIASLVLVWLACHQVTAQNLYHVAPSNWWVGMNNPHLQIMFHGDQLASYQWYLKPYEGVELVEISRVENKNYVFVDITINSLTRAGDLVFELKAEDEVHEVKYSLFKKEDWQPQAMDQSDFIYLLMPDRFSNGDPSNDAFANMADTIVNRNNPWARHGGDLQGVTNHLDYFKELGVTALWLNPVVENNQPQTDEGGDFRSAYHGYGFTDHYNVDKRLGGNAAYKNLVDAAHKAGLKIIQDAVYNHFGINHYTIQDLPMKSWLNQWDTYTNTTYKDQALMDPHASLYDVKQTMEGWFMPFLPDVNQKNPFVANYLIQHALWTMEYFHIDAWRIDTYFYNDFDFMNRCNTAIKEQYPSAFIFGESWVNSVPNQAYLMENNMDVLFKCNLPGTVDFQVYFAINAALNENYGWNEGVQKLYQTLAQDYLYKKPENLVTFVDNHDLDRFLSVIGEDEAKFKMGLVWLMTLRGIPQLYYGTEIMMKNFKNPTDAEVRKDFPGGWAEDEVNKFNKEGRNAQENASFEFIKTLAKLRANSDAISKGKFTQFMPFDNGVYVYFRHYENDLVMVLSNTTGDQKSFGAARFAEFLKNKTKAEEVLSNQQIDDLSSFQLAPQEVKILHFK